MPTAPRSICRILWDEKTKHLESGVRIDAFARWPSEFEAGGAAGDIVHVSDLFTAFARIAGATDYIQRELHPLVGYSH